MINAKEKEEIDNLVKRFKLNNDMEAFETLYKKTSREIATFLKYAGADEFTIDDVLSTTFMLVYQKAKHKVKCKDCYFWILKIAKYTLYNYNRKFKRETSYETIEFEIEDRKQSNFEEYVSIKDLIDNLSNMEKQILQLKVYQSMTYNQIAEILNISKSTVIRRYDRIRKLIERINKDE